MAESRHKAFGASSRFGRIALGVVALVIMAAAIFAAYSWWQSRKFNQWVLDDANRLTPYSEVLFPAERKTTEPQYAKLDAALTSQTLAGRLPVELTRSGYYWGFGSEETWVKTVLVTSKPGDETAQRKIKLLHHLQKKGDDWEVVSVEELAIP